MGSRHIIECECLDVSLDVIEMSDHQVMLNLMVVHYAKDTERARTMAPRREKASTESKFCQYLKDDHKDAIAPNEHHEECDTTLHWIQVTLCPGVIGIELAWPGNIHNEQSVSDKILEDLPQSVKLSELFDEVNEDDNYVLYGLIMYTGVHYYSYIWNASSWTKLNDSVVTENVTWENI